MKIFYKRYLEDNIKKEYNKFQKRSGYFIASDKTFLTGSPYRNSSSFVETYYQGTVEFVEGLKLFCTYNSDYKLNLLQQNTIKLIKKTVGIDILKNESTAGALSVYNRLPAFHVGGNYNSARGRRYIIISTLDDLFEYDNINAQIEIIDSNKILYNSIQNLHLDFEYQLPADLEDFSQLHISIFATKTNKNVTEKIYEEKFHLIRSFNIGMSVGGGNSKIVRNRYLNKEIDKIAVYDHIDTITKNQKDFFDIEQSYKSLILGRDKGWLESKYFGNDSRGREEFLGWVRNILHNVKTVKIIDAYFDNYALDDFLSCCDTRFQLTVVTTNPKTRKNTLGLLKNISKSFPDNKVYYVSKLHDRYLYTEDNSEQKLYLLSNSWNGTVNNYSMYVQEIPLQEALKIYDEINTYLVDENLQKQIQTAEKKRKVYSGRKYNRKYIESLFVRLKNIVADDDINEVVYLSSELFFADYYGQVEKEMACQEVRNCLAKLSEQNIINIIDLVTEKLLKEQKKSFDEDSSYIDGEAFSWYDSPRKCLERNSNITVWGTMRSRRLSLDYGLSEVLNVCFTIYPKYVINALTDQEKNICVKKVNRTDTPILEYHVSEYIIQSFLTDYYPLDGIISEQAWNFLENAASYIYIRMFFAVSIIDEVLFRTDEKKLNFGDIIEIFAKLHLHQDETSVVLGSAFNTIILQWQPPNGLQVNYRNNIINYIAEKTDKTGIVFFVLIAFIESYDIKIDDFIRLIEKLEQFEKTSEITFVEKLFLLYALQTNTSLQSRVSTLLGIDKRMMLEYFVMKTQIDKDLPILMLENLFLYCHI
jgi:hypothetical protein